MYKIKTSPLQCELRQQEGYFCSDGQQFVIEANLVLGQVINQKKELVSGIRVDLKNEDGSTVQSEVTNEEGRYYFDDVYPKTYKVVPQLDGVSDVTARRFVPESRELRSEIGIIA